MTGKFLWSSFFSICILFNHNVPLLSTITSTPFFSCVSLVMTYNDRYLYVLCAFLLCSFIILLFSVLLFIYLYIYLFSFFLPSPISLSFSTSFLRLSTSLLSSFKFLYFSSLLIIAVYFS